MTATHRSLLTATRCCSVLRARERLLAVASDCSSSLPSTSGRAFTTDAAGYDSAEALRDSLLQGALKHVKERGWTDAALVAAARELKLSPAVTGVVPRGAGELVDHFIELSNSRCLDQLEADKDDLQKLPLNERIARALQRRLELIHPVIDSWPQALAVAAKPANAPHSLKLLFELMDGIWAALGDDSTDVTWYSKRAMLAGVYTSTSLYMLADYSPSFQDTWAALRRRVDEGLALDASVQRLVHRGGPQQQQQQGQGQQHAPQQQEQAPQPAPSPPQEQQRQQQQQQPAAAGGP